VTDALRSVVDKLVRRHPHVFGDAVRASTPEEVLGRWEEVKARERSDAASTKTTLSGIPKTLPGLLRAWEMGTRAAAVGFDWERASDVLGKIEEEVAELRQAVERDPAAGRDEIELEMGDLLFAIANLSRKLGIEPEAALRRANDKFTRRFTALERRILERGGALQQTPLDAMEVEWERIKGEEDGGDQ
jgi:ATP diphosphatase